MTASSFLQTLNAGGDTMPGVAYVAVATHNDNTITPPESAFLTATNESSVHNVWIQDGCLAWLSTTPADHDAAGGLADPDRPRLRTFDSPARTCS